MNRAEGPPLAAADVLVLHISGDVPHAVVRIVGELDMLSAPHLDSELARLRTSGYRRVDLDMADITFLAAAGLAVLAAADLRYREASGQLRITRLTHSGQRLLAMTGLDATLTIC